MSLCLNPSETFIRVAVSGGIVVLKVRAASVEEVRRVRKSSGTPDIRRNKLEWKDESADTILQVMDDMLLDASALDANGQPTELTYTTADGEERVLNNLVDNWKSYINETIKLAAGREFFVVNAEIGEDLVKN